MRLWLRRVHWGCHLASLEFDLSSCCNLHLFPLTVALGQAGSAYQHFPLPTPPAPESGAQGVCVCAEQSLYVKWTSSASGDY